MAHRRLPTHLSLVLATLPFVALLAACDGGVKPVTCHDFACDGPGDTYGDAGVDRLADGAVTAVHHGSSSAADAGMGDPVADPGSSPSGTPPAADPGPSDDGSGADAGTGNASDPGNDSADPPSDGTDDGNSPDDGSSDDGHHHGSDDGNAG